MMLFFRRALPILIALCAGLLVFAQNALPQQAQIYRFIHLTSNERAGDVRWIEIWERRDAVRDDRDWIMVDMVGTDFGIESSCYYALAIGGGTPLYMKDGELQPVSTADELFQNIENRRLADNSEVYAGSLDCVVQDTAVVNGIESEQCIFENEDASGVFLVRTPATAQGELWKAVDGQYPVRYQFEAQGSTGSVAHRYELLPAPANFQIQPPIQPDMMCFDDGFIYPQDATVLTSNLTFAVFESTSSSEELKRFYDLELMPLWEAGNATAQGDSIYRYTPENGNQCTLQLRFSNGQNGNTVVAASVFAATAAIDTTDDFATPVVVQNVYSLPVIPFTGTVSAAATVFTEDYEAQGWTLREDLTDIRTDDSLPPEEASAFIVLTQDDQETYISIDAVTAETSRVLIQTRSGLCATPFDVP